MCGSGCNGGRQRPKSYSMRTGVQTQSLTTSLDLCGALAGALPVYVLAQASSFLFLGRLELFEATVVAGTLAAAAATVMLGVNDTTSTITPHNAEMAIAAVTAVVVLNTGVLPLWQLAIAGIGAAVLAVPMSDYIHMAVCGIQY